MHDPCRHPWRMRVEATFQDKKSRGLWFGGHPRAVSTHCSACCCCCAWPFGCGVGAACIHQGQRRRFDRADCRDKSVLRPGRQWFIEILERAPSPASWRNRWPFHRQQHGWRLCSTLLMLVSHVISVGERGACSPQRHETHPIAGSHFMSLRGDFISTSPQKSPARLRAPGAGSDRE